MNFTQDQQKAYDLALEGKNLFITGGAGTGKTFLLQQLIQEFTRRNKRLVVCAPTGTAAIKCGGVTINRVFGLMAGPCIDEKTMKLIVHCPETIERADVVIIDEISMCRMDMFDAVQSAIETAERRSGKMIQVIVVGDFFQLPPVISDRYGERTLLERFYKRGVGRGYAFSGNGWGKCNFLPVVLSQIVRQKNPEFARQLNKARIGDAGSISYFNECANKEILEDAIYVCGRNATADEKNKAELAKIDQTEYDFDARIVGDVKKSDMVVPETITLKRGARVMLVVNNKEEGYWNGSTGTVYGFPGKGAVIVQLDSKKLVRIEPNKWDITRYVVKGEDIVQETIGTFEQLPLKLAYAITIHKSQGATYDRMNLEPNSWDPGQLYVALSRVRDISGMHLQNRVIPRFLQADRVVLDFYNSFTSIAEADVNIADIEEKSQGEIQAETAEAMEKQKKARYRGRLKSTKIPDRIFKNVKDAVQTWVEHPNDTTILAIPNDKLQEVQKLISA